MARNKYYRYTYKDNADKLPKVMFVRLEDDNVVVYDRQLTDKEIKKHKLTPLGNYKARNIVKLRMAKGYTQEELGEITGIGRNAFQRYDLNGAATIPLKYAVTIAKALDCTITDLIDWDDEAFKDYQ